MKKSFPFILTILTASISFNAMSEMTITDDTGGEVIFDKSQSAPQTEHFIPKSNVVQLDNSASNDISQSEINSIQSQGGSITTTDSEADVNTSVVAKAAIGGDGYAQRSARTIPALKMYGSYLDSIDKEIAKLQALPTANYTSSKLSLPTLREGSTGDVVGQLSQSLVDHGFLVLGDQPLPQVYDEDIVAAVKQAQEAFGITVDGVAGPQLYSNLNVDKTQKLSELKAWRDQVNSLIQTGKTEGSKFVLIVNVPSFTLHVINTETGQEELQSKVIVGKPIHQTPIYRMNLIGIKYNPTWTPPMSVVKRVILPNFSNSNRYVSSHGLKAVDGSGNSYSLNSISPSDVLNGRYRIQQPPGTNNSLGIIKFETDSKDDIYLHDTNERPVFNRANRAYSLGCIRVQQWPYLATLLLHANGTEKVFSNINKGKTYIERVNKTPVFITYSLVDSVQGKVGHYGNVYNR